MNRLLLLVVLLALPHLAPAQGGAAAPRDPVEHFFHPFLGDLRTEMDEARSSKRAGVVVMYHFDDCPACQRMKAQVLNRPEVQDWYRSRFVVVPIDIRGAQPITGLDGRTQPESAYGRAMAIRGTPTFDFYGPDGRPLYRHVGGIYDPADFLRLGQFIVSGGFRTQTFKDYLQDARKGKS